MFVGKILLVANLFFVVEANSYAQEGEGSDLSTEEALPEEAVSEAAPEAAPETSPEVPVEAAPSAGPQVEQAADSVPPQGAQPPTQPGLQAESNSLPGAEQPSTLPPSEGAPGPEAQNTGSQQATTETVPPGQPVNQGHGGMNPLVYVFGGLAAVVGLFSLYTFYRRKKTWDEISDAMRIDGGDSPMGSQAPSQFNTQDIAGISNTQVSKPISEIQD